MTNSEKETIMSLRLDGHDGWAHVGSGDHGNGAMSPPEPLTPDAEVLARLRDILACYASETVEERAQSVMLERHERQNKVINLTCEVAELKAEAARDSTNATVETLRMELEGVRAQLQWEQTSKTERQDKIDQLRDALVTLNDYADGRDSEASKLRAEVESLRSMLSAAARDNICDVDDDDLSRDYLIGFHDGVQAVKS